MIGQITKLLQPLSYQQMCKSQPENDNRALSEPFKYMTGTFTQLLSLGSADTLASLSATAMICSVAAQLFSFGTLAMPSLEKASKNPGSCNNSVSDREHFTKCNLEVSHTTLFINFLPILSMSKTSQAFIIRDLAHSMLVRLLVHA